MTSAAAASSAPPRRKPARANRLERRAGRRCGTPARPAAAPGSCAPPARAPSRPGPPPAPIPAAAPVPRTATVPADRPARPVDRLQDLRPAGADEPGQAHDLAGPHGERHVGELAAPAEPVDLQQHVPTRRGPPLGEDVLDGPAGHQPDDLGRRRLRGGEVAGDGAPVLEHGHPVADAADLLEPMRDVDDGDAGGGQLADHPEQVVDLVGVQHRRRLVHHDQPRVPRQRPRHADDLLARRRQPAQLAPRRDLGVPQPGQQAPAPRPPPRAAG